MRLDHQTKELTCKVVYCGPGISGKTTNLHYIHSKAPAKAVGEMVNIDTESERTLHFDLLPLELGKVKGYTCRFEFYTVPGQSYYAATRRLVIEGADGIVFVTDSRREAMDENIESMNDLYEHLRHHQLPDELPIIIQYNKQDLENAIPPEQLNPLLNHRGHDFFSASALTGTGVMETMKRITTLVIQRIKDIEHLEHHISAPAQAPTPVPTPAAQPLEHQSWLLTCHNCDTVLEVPRAEKGDIFTCGSCQTAIEVVDPEHGVTKLPYAKPALETSPQAPDLSLQGGPTTVTPTMSMTPLGQPTIPSRDDSGYKRDAITPLNSDSFAHTPPPSGAPTPIPRSQYTPLTNTPLYNTSVNGGTGMIPQPGEAHTVLQGFTTIGPLESNVLGDRHRVQDIATGIFYRAFVIRETVLRQPGFQQQLENQVHMCSGLRQSNTLKADSVRQGPNGLVLLSPDTPDYEPLSHLLTRRKTLKPPQAMEILRQLCLALEDAARHGLTHGWIRPDAVLINSYGNILLDDLAIPKLHHYLVRESMGESAATTYYLAPEHIKPNDPTDIRTDIFLIGALLFHCLTSSGLVTGFNAHEALHKINNKGAPKLRDTHPEVSRALNDFCAQLTEVERKDRFQTYKELLDRIDKFGGGARRATVNGTRSITRGNAQAGPGERSGGQQNTGNNTQNRRMTHNDIMVSQSPSHKKQSSTGKTLFILFLLTICAAVAGYLYLEEQKGKQQNSMTPVESTTDEQSSPQTNAKDGNQTTETLDSSAKTNLTPAMAVRLPDRTKQLMGICEKDPYSQDKLVAARDIVPHLRGHAKERMIAQHLSGRITHAIPISDASTDQTPPSASAASPADDQMSADTTKTTTFLVDSEPAPPEPKLLTQKVKQNITRLINEQRFAEARSYIHARLDAGGQRLQQLKRVTDAHQRHRSAIMTQINNVNHLEKVMQLVAPASTKWGSDKDREWADALLKIVAQKHADRIQQQAQTTLAHSVPTSLDAELSLNGIPRMVVDSDSQIDQALQYHNSQKADQLPENAQLSRADLEALTRKLQPWNQKPSLINNALNIHKPKLRLTPPIDSELWDVQSLGEQSIALKNLVA